MDLLLLYYWKDQADLGDLVGLGDLAGLQVLDCLVALVDQLVPENSFLADLVVQLDRQDRQDQA